MFNACRGPCPTLSSVSAFNVNMSARAQSQSRLLAYGTYPADVVILGVLDSCSRPTFPFSYNFCVHFLKRSFLIIQTLTLLLLHVLLYHIVSQIDIYLKIPVIKILLLIFFYLFMYNRYYLILSIMIMNNDLVLLSVRQQKLYQVLYNLMRVWKKR